MRLVRVEIDKRLEVKLDKSINTNGANGVMTFGANNDYPQIIERLISGSVTSKLAAGVYANFLTGQGFENENINSIVVGKDQKGKEITLITLLRQSCQSISYNNGAYIHFNVSLNRQIRDTKLVPFKNCRFAKIDDTGYTHKIGIYDNWEREKDKKFKKDEINWIDIFNLGEKAFASLIEKEGFEKYKGQINFLFLDNQFIYPLSPFDPVYMDCDTESQISLYKNRQLRNGFFNKIVFRMQEPENEEEKDEMEDKVKGFMGPDGDIVMMVIDEVDEEGNIKEKGSYKIDEIKSNVDDKLFENWDKSIPNNIRKATKAPAILIDYEENKLGTTSGEAIVQATNYYNKMTQDDRASISGFFEEIFSHSENQKLRDNKDWNIKPLNLYDGSTTDLNTATSD